MLRILWYAPTYTWVMTNAFPVSLMIDPPLSTVRTLRVALREIVLSTAVDIQGQISAIEYVPINPSRLFILTFTKLVNVR